VLGAWGRTAGEGEIAHGPAGGAFLQFG
jgi:hypothetical protein